MNRCSSCPGVNKCVPSQAPCNDYTLHPIMLVGEAPGRDEDKRGVPFIGKTGQELDEHYLPLAGLRRGDVYVTNAIKCLPISQGGRLDMSKSKDVDMLMSCAGTHLADEIYQIEPRLIVAMGAFACAALDPDINLELQHGIPIETSWGTVFPMYHPAGGIHEPKKMLLIRNDWVRLGKYLKRKLVLPVDEYSIPIYTLLTPDNFETPSEEDSWEGTFNSPMACDTEITNEGEPYCLTFSCMVGTADMVRANDPECIARFQQWIDCWEGPILFHNYLFDKPVVQKMGITIPDHLIVDTMVESFHLGNLPQGLKALAYRELGMRMEDFDDLVTPYSTPVCLDYLRRVRETDWPKPEELLTRTDAGDGWKLYKPQGINTKIKRFFTDYNNNPAKDIFKSWSNWEDSHELIESKLGRWPGKCITHAPFEKVLYYACRDADATLRLWLKQQKMIQNVRRAPQEHWGDYVRGTSYNAARVSSSQR